jgi:hypothetical protein
MAVATTGSADLEIQAADGSWVPLMLKERTDDRGDDLERTLAEVLSASDNDAPISDALKADIREGWSRGVGLDYDAAFGVDTLDPDYACPAGAATDVTVSAGAGAIIAMEEFVGNF